MNNNVPKSVYIVSTFAYFIIWYTSMLLLLFDVYICILIRDTRVPTRDLYLRCAINTTSARAPVQVMSGVRPSCRIS